MIFNKVTLPNIVLKPGSADPRLESGRVAEKWGKEKPGVTWRPGKTRLQIH
jgi:hypothetical protein